MAMRTANVKRQTKETDIDLVLDIDGTGKSNINTGIGFFNESIVPSFLYVTVYKDGTYIPGIFDASRKNSLRSYPLFFFSLYRLRSAS